MPMMAIIASLPFASSDASFFFFTSKSGTGLIYGSFSQARPKRTEIQLAPWWWKRSIPGKDELYTNRNVYCIQ